MISCLLVAKQNNKFLPKKTINLVLLGLCHCLKRLPHLSKLLDMDKDVDMDQVEVNDVVTIKVVVDTILLIIVVLKVKKKKNNSNHQKWNNSEAQPEKGIESQGKHARENVIDVV